MYVSMNQECNNVQYFEKERATPTRMVNRHAFVPLACDDDICSTANVFRDSFFDNLLLNPQNSRIDLLICFQTAWADY